MEEPLFFGTQLGPAFLDLPGIAPALRSQGNLYQKPQCVVFYLLVYKLAFPVRL